MALHSARGFSPSFEAIAHSWRGCASSAESWQATSAAGIQGGQAGGYFVTSGTLNGFAKPSVVDGDQIPRAAHEKIAADLGFDLGLPTCPVVLHRWSTPPAGNQTCVAIALVPFKSVFKWGQVLAAPDIALKLKSEIAPHASKMIAFDSWLANDDRSNDGNLLVSKATDDGSTLGCVYIDHSYTMLKHWRGGHTNISCVGPYPCDQGAVHVDLLDEAIGRIEGLADDTIRDVVERVPTDFLAAADAKLIVDGLLYRKANLRGELRKAFGGIK